MKRFWRLYDPAPHAKKVFESATGSLGSELRHGQAENPSHLQDTKPASRLRFRQSGKHTARPFPHDTTSLSQMWRSELRGINRSCP